MVALSAGLVLNYQNGWYASWRDVLGVGRVRPTSIHQNIGVTQVIGSIAPADHTSLTDYPALPDPGKLVQTFHVRFPGTQLSGKVVVILPKNYYAGDTQRDLYPVIVAYHGIPGDPLQWLRSMDIRPALSSLESEGIMRPAIVVAPQIEAPGGQDTECIFGPSGPTQMEDWLSKTVPAFVVRHVRAIQSGKAWANLGFSAGGWCSAMLTMLHPRTYAVAMVMAGYFRPWWGVQPPWSSESGISEHYDLVKLASSDPPRVALWVEGSTSDKETGWRTEEFLKAVKAARSPLSLTTVMEHSGGHRTSEWIAKLPLALAWLAHNVPAFRA